MCTISFVPTERGFHLAMNRDEKRTRARGLPPGVVSLNGRRAILPRELEGGTWISVNDAGVCLALINWHTIERKPPGKILTRGIVVGALADATSQRSVAIRLKKLPLARLRPFRLLVAAANDLEVIEWQWDLERLRRKKHGWKIAHWFSSGFDEPGVERVRAAVCKAAANRSLSVLTHVRELHRSHSPRRGPFSICMHRKDAATVSYAEITVSPRRVKMRYLDGPPCLRRGATSKSIALVRSP